MGDGPPHAPIGEGLRIDVLGAPLHGGLTQGCWGPHYLSAAVRRPLLLEIDSVRRADHEAVNVVDGPCQEVSHPGPGVGNEHDANLIDLWSTERVAVEGRGVEVVAG